MSIVRYQLSCTSQQDYDQRLVRSLLGIVGQMGGQQVWNYVEGTAVDVLLVDYDAPVAALPQQGKTPIIVGYSEHEQRVKHLPFFLTKPLRARSLSALLTVLAERLALQKEAAVSHVAEQQQKTPVRLALCGLDVREYRMISMALARFSLPQIELTLVNGPDFGMCHFALVNVENPFSQQIVQQIARRNPELMLLELSATGLLGVGAYKLSSRSLLLQLLPLLEQVSSVWLARQQAKSTLPAKPLAKPAPVFSHNEYQQSMSLLSRPLNALIVDDSEVVRHHLAQALQRIGIRAQTASDAQQGMAALTQGDYDFVLLDVVLPDDDGYSICRQIRRKPQWRDLPVLILTSRSSPFDRARGALAGCTSYLTKPVEPKAFYAAIDKIIMNVCRDDRRQAEARGYLQAV